MQQLINNPTRVTELTQSLLDVCITSNPEHIIYSGVFHLGADVDGMWEIWKTLFVDVLMCSIEKN